MTTFAAALVLGPVGPAFYARAPGIGLIARTTALPAENLWVMLASSTWTETVAATTAISTVAQGTVIALFGRDDVDVYAVAEVRAGEVVRSLVYVSDDGGWKLAGEPQPWETDFHFALPLGEFASWLDANAWSGSDIEAARDAHRAHDVTLLPHLPPAQMSLIVEYVKKLGFNWDAGADVRFKRRGLLSRLVGV